MITEISKDSESLETLEAQEAKIEEEASAPIAPKRNVVSRAVYKTFYGLSYGTVFGSLTVARLLFPKDSAIARGLHDGAADARKAVEIKAEEAESVETDDSAEDVAPAAA